MTSTEVTIHREHIDLPAVTVKDDRSEGRRNFDGRRLNTLRSVSRLPDDADERRDVMNLSAAAQEAFRAIEPDLRRLVTRVASRSTPFFLALASGHWVKAAELIESTDVSSEKDRELRRRLIVWLRIQTPNGLEDEPAMSKTA